LHFGEKFPKFEDFSFHFTFLAFNSSKREVKVINLEKIAEICPISNAPNLVNQVIYEGEAELENKVVVEKRLSNSHLN